MYKTINTLFISLSLTLSAQKEVDSASKKFGIVWEIEYLDSASIEFQEALNESNKGIRAFRENDFDGALGHFNNGINLHAGIPKIYSNRGGVYFEKQDFYNALIDYTKALELDSLNPNFLYNRGLVYNATHQYSYAINDFEKSITINPNNPYT
ncbi:tetratricopeptide repeat protein [Brumimicrobium glaciale]|uniref:Tetratricopeptide repeat protein n=1 Tax=Brumimicrobium glaciale TaxID=200475 RepID=A0A4Q4KH65_9FLAO|nr:tetratricopeptide repeat protein [Brumimicrobium glaciale]RYM32593.1 tetratricopeptide repeat protein [Brumimicrobium glaciale]